MTLTQTSATVSNTTIYARLASTATGSSSGNITLVSSGATTKNVAVSGVVNLRPTITVTGTLTAFTTRTPTPSVNQTYTISGTNLTANLVLNAPTGFEISTSSSAGFTTILSSISGSSTTTIYVRLSSSATAGTPSGNISLTSTGADNKTIAVSGTVSSTPVISTSVAALSAFSTTLGIPSAVQSYTVHGTNLSANLVMTAPTGFVISDDPAATFGSSVSLTPTSVSVATTTIYVQIVEAATGTFSGNITHTSTSATTRNVAVSGTVSASSGNRVYYVSPTGSNSNNGLTPSTPFLTLSKFSFSNSFLIPGTTVYLMNGTFGATNLAGTSTNNGLLEIEISGTAANPIRFTNYPGHTPLVQFNGWNGILIQASYIQVDGIKVRGNNSVKTLAAAQAQPVSCGNSGSVDLSFQGNGINVDGRNLASRPTNIIIKNCEVYECGGGGIATSEGDYITIENNIVYNCAWYSVYANSGISVFHAYNSDANTTDYKHIIRKNIVYGNDQLVGTSSCSFTDGNGIIIDDFRNTQASSTIGGQIYTGKTLVENNIVYNNGGRGIHAFTSDKVTILNNTTCNNSGSSNANGDEGEITLVLSNNSAVYNNVMYARTGKKLTTYSSSTGLTEGNNLMYNSGTFAYFNNTDIIADPQFVNIVANNFRLSGSSFGIDRGNTTAGLFSTEDFDGTARPYNGTADIGAYEYTSTVPSSTCFGDGNLAVLRVGDGSTPLSSSTTNVNVLEYNASGSATGVNLALSNFLLTGTNANEGQLNLSGDGEYLTAVGYSTSSGTGSDKVIARIDNRTGLDLSTKITTASAFSTSIVRGAVTENGSNFQVAASTTARQVNFSATTASTFTGAAASFSLQRFGGVTYYINSQIPGYMSSGTAVNFTTAASPAVQFSAAGVSQALYLLDADPSVSFNGTGYDLMYIPDITNGLRKWYFNGSVWVYGGLINPTASPNPTGGFYAVSAKMVNGKPELYAIKGAASNNVMMKIIDNSGRTGDWSTTAPTATTLAAAGANYMFRGLAFTPSCRTGNNITASLSTPNAAVCTNGNAVFNISGTTNTTVTYSINGGANTTAILSGGANSISIPTSGSAKTVNLISTTDGSITQSLGTSATVSVYEPTISGTLTVNANATTTLTGSGAKYSYKGIGGYGSQMTYSYRQNRRNQLYKYAGLDGSSVLMKWYDYNGGPNGHTPIGGYAECRLMIKSVNPTKEIGTIINALDTLCDTISPKSKYPFNIAAAFGWGHDDLATFISNPFIDAAKNGTTEKRTVRVSNEVDFFEDVAKTYPNLPSEAVSYGNEWDVYCASMNETTAKVRRSLEKLRSAEALAVIVGLKKPDFAAHLTASRNLAWESFGMYWEHNWTADGPVKRSIRADWENKLARQITNYVDTLYTLSKDLLSQQIKKSDNANPKFYVFNPLSWVRDDVADFLFEENYPVKVVDVSTRQEVDNQLIIKNGRRYIRIFAEGIPSVGYKVFEIKRGTPKSSSVAATVANDYISNSYYKIRFNPSGVISELYDKKAKRDLVKTTTTQYLNDLGIKNIADGDPLSIENAGAVSVTLKAVSHTPVLHTVRLTLFKNSPRIEIEDSIQANFKDVKTWAFSFNLDKPTTRHEELGAILTVKKEKNGGHYADQNARYDWQTFNHFADMSESNYGVTLSNQDCSFFKLGNSKVDSLDETAAQIQALAGGQVDKKVEDGGMMGIFNQNGDTAFCYKFALSTHQTAFDPTKALKFALAHQNPLVTGRVEGDESDSNKKSADKQSTFSFLNISDPSVLLWSLKPAEDGGGLITRFWHTNAAPTTALLTLNRPLSKAWETTHIETNAQQLLPLKNGLQLDLKQHQLKTYRLILK